MVTMANLQDYDFEPLDEFFLKHSEELFINAYINECYESKYAHYYTSLVCTIISSKYEDSKLLKKYLTVSEMNGCGTEKITLLRKYETLFLGGLGTWVIVSV